MSIIHRPKAAGRHRADDRIAKLERHLAAVQADNAKLLNFKAAADDYFMLLVDDRRQVYDAWRAEGQKRTEAEIVAACTLADLETAHADLAELRAFKANAQAVNVPPMERDTTAVEDQATGPTDVRPLWEAHGTGPATGHIRQARWGVDDTQPLTTVDEVA